jgi:glycine cleavage system aminomethyltransferase T
MIAGLCESPLTFQAITIWRDELLSEDILLRDVIDLEATFGRSLDGEEELEGPPLDDVGGGEAAARRPGLLGPEREQLVGLQSTSGATITAGAHLFTPGDVVARATDQGYVTSVGFSPTLGAWLGLGFLKNGRARIGETVRLVDHLRGIDVLCEVADPVFHDREGVKLRA